MLYDNSMYRRSTKVNNKCLQYHTVDKYNGCTEQQVYSVISPTRTDYVYIPPTQKPFQVYSPTMTPQNQVYSPTMTPQNQVYSPTITPNSAK